MLILLDFVKLPFLVDSIGILVNSKSFTGDDYNGIASWLQQYLSWLTSSARGQADSGSPNNQGTWYDVQRLSLQLFLGLNDEASTVVSASTIPRMNSQLLPDGSQPLEQSRPLSWLYSSFNLKALFFVAYLSQSTSVNLFQYQDPQGRSIPRALNYLIPYASNNGTNWPVPNMGDYNPNTVIELCKQAYVVYRDTRYINTANALQYGIPKTSNPNRLWNPYLAFDNIRSSAFTLSSLNVIVVCMFGWVLFM